MRLHGAARSCVCVALCAGESLYVSLTEGLFQDLQHIESLLPLTHGLVDGLGPKAPPDALAGRQCHDETSLSLIVTAAV